MFIVMEIQVFEEGKTSTPCYAFDDRNLADQTVKTAIQDAIAKMNK